MRMLREPNVALAAECPSPPTGWSAIYVASLRAKFAATLIAALAFGGVAPGAMAASLSVTVKPARVHPGGRYTVAITGRYDRRVRRRAPYLLAFIQYTGMRCRHTAPKEYALPQSSWNWDFYPERRERTSPFQSVRHWKAGRRLGARRVCAYLYASQVSPATTAKPLARAGTSFRDVRK